MQFYKGSAIAAVKRTFFLRSIARYLHVTFFESSRLVNSRPLTCVTSFAPPREWNGSRIIIKEKVMGII